MSKIDAKDDSTIIQIFSVVLQGKIRKGSYLNIMGQYKNCNVTRSLTLLSFLVQQ